MKHIGLKLLFIQDVVARREVLLKKVRGVENPADLFAKGVGRAMMARRLARAGL